MITEMFVVTKRLNFTTSREHTEDIIKYINLSFVCLHINIFTVGFKDKAQNDFNLYFEVQNTKLVCI